MSLALPLSSWLIRRATRLHNGIVLAPSDIKAGGKSAGVHVALNCPVLKALGNPVNSNHPVSSGVSSLFLLCSPSAVLWAVVSIVVDAVNRVLGRWPRPHVLDKCLKRVSPSFTDLDATPTVQREPFIGWVGATLNHHDPDFVNGGFRKAVRSIYCDGYLSHETPARASSSGFGEIMPRYDMLVSAFAATKPSRLPSRSALGSGDYSQSSVNVSDSVDKRGHRIAPMLLNDLCGRPVSNRLFGSDPSHALILQSREHK